MAKRDITEWDSERSVIEKRSSREVEVQEEEPTYVRVVLLKTMTLKYTGHITGTLYVFGGAGSEQNVDTRDWEIMKNKKQRSCCEGSATRSSNYFELVS